MLDKLRLVMLFIICQSGMKQVDRTELLKSVDLRLQKAVRALEKLGVDITTVTSSQKISKDKTRLAEFAKRNKDSSISLNRYVPALETIAMQLCESKLEEKQYPIVQPTKKDASHERKLSEERKKEGQSARTHHHAHNWRLKDSEHKAGNRREELKQKVAEDKRPLLIIFMQGGLTYGELKTIYEVAENEKWKKQVNLLVGSNCMITPKVS
jgi:hypothetical protein